MPIQGLLSQVLAEHEALQSRYDEALVEISLLRTCLANEGTAKGSSTESVEEDVEAAPPQFQFSCEPVHCTLDSGADINSEGVRGGTNVKALRKVSVDEDNSKRSSQTSKASDFSKRISPSRLTEQELHQRATLTAKASDYLQVGAFNHSAESLTGNPHQDRLIGFLRNKVVELFLVVVVISNVVVLWVETDRRAARLPKVVWSEIANVVFLVIYLSEFIVRVLAYRTDVFDDKWNRLDFGVIAIDISCIIIEALFGSSFPGGINASIFRLFRVFRLVRVFAIFRYVPELQLLIHGFFGALKAVFFATIMLFVVVLLWSFIFVEAINPQVYELIQLGKFDDCPRCQRSYESMWDAHMTILQQIVAGDSWGMITLEVIFAHPETSILFIACLMSIQFAVLNLIFTVIVDAAMRAREEDELLKLAEKENTFLEAKTKLTALSESLDTTRDGALTLDELIDGYKSNKVFAETMASMDISCDDMGALFMIMDNDRSGQVSHVEFVNNIYRMKERDIHTTLMFLQIHMEDVRVKMKEEVTSMLRSNLTQTLETAKHIEKVMSHVEDMTQHLDIQRKDPDGNAELRKPQYLEMQQGDQDGEPAPEVDPSAFETAAEQYFKAKERGRETWM